MNRLIILLGLCVTALIVALGLWSVPVLERARDAVFDTYQRASPRIYDPAVPVHIIDIDEAALDEWGQWAMAAHDHGGAERGAVCPWGDCRWL